MRREMRQVVDQTEIPMRNHQQNALKKTTLQIRMKVINSKYVLRKTDLKIYHIYSFIANTSNFLLSFGSTKN